MCCCCARCCYPELVPLMFSCWRWLWRELPTGSRQHVAGSPVFILEKSKRKTVSRSSQSKSASSTVIRLFELKSDADCCYCDFSKFAFFEYLDDGLIRGRNSGARGPCTFAMSSSSFKRFSSLTCSIDSRKNCSISDR